MNPPAKKQRVNSGSFRISFDALFNNLKKQLVSIEDTQFINGPKIDVRGYLWQIRLHKINKNVEVVLVYLGPHETCVAQFELEFEPNLGFGKEVFEQYTYPVNKTSEYMCIFDCDKAPDVMTVKVRMEIFEEKEHPEGHAAAGSGTAAIATVTPTASTGAPVVVSVTGTVAPSVSFAPSVTSTSTTGLVTTHHLIPPPIAAGAPAAVTSHHTSSSGSTPTAAASSAGASKATTVSTQSTSHATSHSFSAVVSPKNEPIMYRLYRERTFSDCTFLISGKSVTAHRFVLCYGSRVFRNIFLPEGNKPDASNSTEIVVADTTLEVFELFLKYMYTHQCESSVLLSQCAALLALAAKYQVDGLVNICVNHMISHQGIHTATDILLSAEQHGLTSVKRAVIGFIVANMKRMTKETDMLSRLDSKLKDEIIRAI